MKRLFPPLLANLTLILLSSCMTTGGLITDLNEESRVLRGELGVQTAKTRQLHAQRAELRSRLISAQAQEKELMAGGVTPDEEIPLSRARQKIATLNKQLNALADAG